MRPVRGWVEHERVLGRRRDAVARGALRVVVGVGVVERADRADEVLERLGQVVVGGLQVGPDRVAADLRDHLVHERLDAEHRVAPQAADVPAAGLARRAAPRTGRRAGCRGGGSAVGWSNGSSKMRTASTCWSGVSWASRNTSTLRSSNSRRSAGRGGVVEAWSRSKPKISAPMWGLLRRTSRSPSRARVSVMVMVPPVVVRVGGGLRPVCGDAAAGPADGGRAVPQAVGEVAWRRAAPRRRTARCCAGAPGRRGCRCRRCAGPRGRTPRGSGGSGRAPAAGCRRSTSRGRWRPPATRTAAGRRWRSAVRPGTPRSSVGTPSSAVCESSCTCRAAEPAPTRASAGSRPYSTHRWR